MCTAPCSNFEIECKHRIIWRYAILPVLLNSQQYGATKLLVSQYIEREFFFLFLKTLFGTDKVARQKFHDSTQHLN